MERVARAQVERRAAAARQAAVDRRSFRRCARWVAANARRAGSASVRAPTIRLSTPRVPARKSVSRLPIVRHRTIYAAAARTDPLRVSVSRIASVFVDEVPSTEVSCARFMVLRSSPQSRAAALRRAEVAQGVDARARRPRTAANAPRRGHRCRPSRARWLTVRGATTRVPLVARRRSVNQTAPGP